MKPTNAKIFLLFSVFASLSCVFFLMGCTASVQRPSVIDPGIDIGEPPAPEPYIQEPAPAEPTITEETGSVYEELSAWNTEEPLDDAYFEEHREDAYLEATGYAHPFKAQGVIESDDFTYTWYSEKVLPGGGLDDLNGNGRHLDDEGFVRDGDGYISVASSDLPIGAIVDTPFGEGMVYDTGCAPGVIDIYTGW